VSSAGKFLLYFFTLFGRLNFFFFFLPVLLSMPQNDSDVEGDSHQRLMPIETSIPANDVGSALSTDRTFLDEYPTLYDTISSVPAELLELPGESNFFPFFCACYEHGDPRLTS
jgi:hypothetical protein